MFTLTTKMANREVLNTQKRKKNNVIMAEIPIKFKMSASEGVIPDIPGHENLPPLHLHVAHAHTHVLLPLAIYM